MRWGDGSRESDDYNPMGIRRHPAAVEGTTIVGGTLNTITPCAACKLLRRRCAQECPFAPYFSPNDPQRFAAVHKVFGASNVSKMLMEVPEAQRSDAANSLVYEANVRLRDPIYGCMGAIIALQQQVRTLEAELNTVRTEILRHKYRQQVNSTVTHSIPCTSDNRTLFSSSAEVFAADPPAAVTQPPPAPSPSTSSMYAVPSSSTDYSTITNEQNTLA